MFSGKLFTCLFQSLLQQRKRCRCDLTLQNGPLKHVPDMLDWNKVDKE